MFPSTEPIRRHAESIVAAMSALRRHQSREMDSSYEEEADAREAFCTRRSNRMQGNLIGDFCRLPQLACPNTALTVAEAPCRYQTRRETRCADGVTDTRSVTARATRTRAW